MDAVQLDMFAELENVSDSRMPKIPSCEILEHEDKKLCMDCWENKAFVDEDETDKDEGWCVCPTCKEKVGALCKSGLCAECDYKKKHPDAQKKYCEQCIHFFYHDLYDENNHTECCCKLHLAGKNRGEWSYLCDDFVKCETAEQHEIKRAGLMKYASYKQMGKRRREAAKAAKTKEVA